MISFLRGQVAARGPGWVDLDVAGIGFRLLVSGQAAGALPAPGQPATVAAELIVREDAVLLFGFRDEEERRAFRALSSVAGVGPKTALAILSAFTPQALARVVEAEDTVALCRVPGVGRKTAQRVLLDLRGRLPASAAEEAAGPAAEARAALVALGYSATEAAAAVEGAAAQQGQDDAAALLRASLRNLGRAR